jgi:hypothetical protein
MSQDNIEQIQRMIEETFDKKIDGKLKDITSHLGRQDKILERVEDLLEDKDFLVKLWAFIKFLGGVLVAIGSAVLLYNRIIK